MLRPLRDEMGIAGGVRKLQWLFTATFVVMLAAVPVFGAMVARLPRRRFVPLVYHFFVVNIAIFWLLLTFDVAQVQVARVFFVWISVFNLFAVSVFWSFMADLFASGQGKRLFGFIAAGGSAGALLGPALTVVEKYKAKNVIDIVVFRSADALSGWLFAVLRGAGLELSTISLATVPVMGVWLALAIGLGCSQERRARRGGKRRG